MSSEQGTDLNQPAGFESSAPTNGHLASRSVAYLSIVNFAAQVGDRLFSFGQVAIIAALYGAGTNADLYFLASIVPLTIGAVIGEPLSRAFLTLLVRTTDRKEGTELAAAGLLFGTGVLVAVTLVYLPVAWIAVRIAAPAGSTDYLTWAVFAVLGPTIGLTFYLGAVLLWLERYALAALRTPLSSLTVLIAMYLVSRGTSTVLSLAVGVAGGAVVAFVVMYAAIARRLGVGWGLRLTRPGVRVAVGSHRRLFGPVIGGVVGGQVIVLIERLLAAALGAGAVSTISYARGIAGAPAAVGLAVGAGTYPALVRAQAVDSRSYVLESIVRGLRFTATVSISIAIFVALFSTSIVQVLFQRGHFIPTSTDRVSTVLVAFALSTFAANIIGYLAQMLYGLDRFTALLWVQAVVFIAYVVLASIMRITGGLVGLALAFSLAQVAGAAAAYFLTAREIDLGGAAFRRRVARPVFIQALPIALVLGGLRLAEGEFRIATPLLSTVLAAAVVVSGAAVTLVLERLPDRRALHRYAFFARRTR